MNLVTGIIIAGAIAFVSYDIGYNKGYDRGYENGRKIEGFRKFYNLQEEDEGVTSKEAIERINDVVTKYKALKSEIPAEMAMNVIADILAVLEESK